MGNAIATYSLQDTLALPKSPTELKCRKPHSVSRPVSGGESRGNFDIKVNHIISTRALNDPSPVKDCTIEINNGPVPTLFSQGKRKSQNARASDLRIGHGWISNGNTAEIASSIAPGLNEGCVGVGNWPEERFCDNENSIPVTYTSTIHPLESQINPAVIETGGPCIQLLKPQQQCSSSAGFASAENGNSPLIDEGEFKSVILHQILPSDGAIRTASQKAGKHWVAHPSDGSRYVSEASITLPFRAEAQFPASHNAELTKHVNGLSQPGAQSMIAPATALGVEAKRPNNPAIEALRTCTNGQVKSRAASVNSLDPEGPKPSIQKKSGRFNNTKPVVDADTRSNGRDSNGSNRSVRSINSLVQAATPQNGEPKSKGLENSNDHSTRSCWPASKIVTSRQHSTSSLLTPDSHESFQSATHIINQTEARRLVKQDTYTSLESNSSAWLEQAMNPMPSEYHGMRYGTAKRNEAIAKFRMFKFNSTSTLFVESTMISADLQESLRYMSIYLASSIRKGATVICIKTPEILSEKIHLLSHHIQFYRRPPSEEEIFRFLECLFISTELSVECVIISLIYVQRMIGKTGISIQPINWARIVLGGVILASKVWDDHAVWNVDFCQIFPDVNVSDLNDLERFFMESIKYDVSVRASVYARYYFELRDMAETASRPWPLKPLKRNETHKLTTSPQNTTLPDSTHQLQDMSVLVKELHVFAESQTALNLKHLRPNKKMPRSYSDFRFMPRTFPAFVL
ncbi:hypothetical protein BASA50_001641 [Batrachochytrium salamandrivorans]|uniref:Cyclin N-terminal domain-containing protein n=1 Tax=Batrachochytrium salamandrivorans TaxID=1357716 RepID=A0ABQ8FNK9_9FUNG|nr:hypothetical protein BASA50_001641 [Batrachochytrium salamandrivorans]